MKYFEAIPSLAKYEIVRRTGNTTWIQGHFIWDNTWERYRFHPRDNNSFDEADLLDLAKGLREVE